jgi:hypothetical protein
MQALLDVLSGHNDPRPALDVPGWETFAAEASRHGVSALAYRALGRDGHAPAHVVQALESHYLRNRLRNLRLYARLTVLLNALAAQAIDVVVLKGAFLARVVYPDAALRPMSDADLLVRSNDLERAAHTVRELGWTQAAPVPEGGHQLPTFELAGVQVDLHWSIEDDAAPFAIDVGGLWQRAVPVRLGEVQALALSAEDLLLHLCLHTAYNHGWLQFDGGLRQLADIAAVVRHYESTLDWSAFAARAHAWRASRCAWLSLVTARNLLRADVPDAVLDWLAPAHCHAQWTRTAVMLALGSHYADLARCLPVVGRSWMNKRWRVLPRNARWRALLLPTPASLRRVYPALKGRAAIAHVAHWKDLASEVFRLGFNAGDRARWSLERERRALVGWLEGHEQEPSVSDRQHFWEHRG